MKFKLIQSLYLAILLLPIISLSSVAQAQPPVMDESVGNSKPLSNQDPDKVLKFSNTPDKIPTTTASLNGSVKCIMRNNTFVTVAKQGEVTAVLFSWRTTEFGPEYTPKDRCRIVSNKFDNLVQSNGGSFNNLYLTTAIVNGYPVICTRKADDIPCNILFTLSRRNRNQAEKILLSLRDPSSLEATGIEESSSANPRPVVDLGKWSRQNLRSSPVINATPASPESVKQPLSNPGRSKFK